MNGDAKATRDVKEGMIFSYIHHDAKLGVLAEVACETDFVARNEQYRQFGKDLCLHIAAQKPRFLSLEEIPEEEIVKERNFQIERAREQMKGKPDDVIEKAVDGRVQKFFGEQCLLEQTWVKDPNKTVEQVRKELVGSIGENIQVRRFARMELGG